MTKETWMQFKKAAIALTYDEIQEGEKYPIASFRESYTGRGSNKETYAITLPNNKYLLSLIAMVGNQTPKDEIQELTGELLHFRTDSLGKGIIVY